MTESSIVFCTSAALKAKTPPPHRAGIGVLVSSSERMHPTYKADI